MTRIAGSWWIGILASLALACGGGGSGGGSGGGGGGGGTTTWAKRYTTTGTGQIFGFSAVQGGWIAAGENARTTTPYDWNAWVMKTDASGTPSWQIELSTALEDTPTSVAATPDGGCVVAGGTWDQYATATNPWIAKLDAAGALSWTKRFNAGVSQSLIQSRDAVAVRPTSDGGLVLSTAVAWSTNSPQGWIAKLSAAGDVAWQVAYGDDASYLTVYSILSIEQTSDGGYVAVGEKGFGLWVLKVSSTGGVAWQRALANASPGSAFAVRETADGGFAVTGYRSDSTLGHEGALLLKLSSTGVLQWQKFYSSANASAVGYDLLVLPDGGLLVAGESRSMAGSNAWLMKTDAAGATLWQRALGLGGQGAFHVARTSDGHLVVATNDVLAQVAADGTITFSATGGATEATSTFTAGDGGLADVTETIGTTTTSYVAGDAGFTRSVLAGTVVTTLAP